MQHKSYPLALRRRNSSLRALNPAQRDQLLDQSALLSSAGCCKDAPQCIPFIIQCDVKFPQPHHLSSFITNLTGNGEFLERRYKDLTLYFEAINKITELENSLGIKIMLFGKTSDFPMVDLSMIPPMAPRIKGKKLVAKIVEAQIC